MSTPLPYMTDSYNATHHMIRNKKETHAVAYMYNRKEPMILFGLAGIVNQLQNKRVYDWDIENAGQDAYDNGFEFNKKLWYDLIKKFNGYPFGAVTVEQVPELALYPAGCPLAKISSSYAPELVTYFEGALTKCFFPSMVLTNLYKYKEAGIKNLHNFSYRSCFSEEDSYWVALAFSMLYDGTDNFNINYLRRVIRSTYVDNDLANLFKPYTNIIHDLEPKTIIALNHREVQSWKNELEMIENVIPKAKNRALAMPIDTYDYERFIINYVGYALRLASENNCSLHFRIDSGDHIQQAEHILNQIITFKEMNALTNKPMPSFGIIIGDHMRLSSMLEVLTALKNWKKERKVDKIDLDDYVYFGLGGSLLEGISRDKGGIVTKLGHTNYVGNTMKTAKGKESLLGNLGIKWKGDEYRVFFDSVFYGDSQTELYNNYLLMKSGYSDTLTPKVLNITQEVRNEQEIFVRKVFPNA